MTILIMHYANYQQNICQSVTLKTSTINMKDERAFQGYDKPTYYMYKMCRLCKNTNIDAVGILYETDADGRSINQRGL